MLLERISKVSLLLISFESHRYAMLLERRCLKQGLPLFVCMRFQDLFHSPPGVLFAFPSRYWFTIGRSRVFSLGGWSPHLRTGFHVSRSTSRFLSTIRTLSPTGLSPTIAGLSRTFRLKFVLSKARLLRVRSPLLPESRLISFPEDT